MEEFEFVQNSPDAWFNSVWWWVVVRSDMAEKVTIIEIIEILDSATLYWGSICYDN